MSGKSKAGRVASQARKPRKKSAKKSKPDQKCETAQIEISDIRLGELLIKRYQGFTQLECADYFGVSDRTIRNWLNSPEKHKVLAELGKKIDPAGQVGRYMMRVAAREAGNLRMKRQAEAEGKHAAVRGYEAELRHLANDQIKIFQDLGLFKYLKFESPSDEDRAAKGADYLGDLIGDLLIDLGSSHQQDDRRTGDEEEETDNG